MYHTLAYLGMINSGPSLPLAQRGYLLRSQLLFVQQLHRIFAPLDENSFVDDLADLIDTVVRATMPAESSHRQAVAAQLLAHAPALETCVHTDCATTIMTSHTLNPVKAAERVHAPRLEAFYLLGPDVLAPVPVADRAAFVATLQLVVQTQCPHSVVVFQRDAPTHRLIVHYNAMDPSEEGRLAHWLEAAYVDALKTRRGGPRRTS